MRLALACALTSGLVAVLLAPSVPTGPPAVRLDLLGHVLGFALVHAAWRLAVGRRVVVVAGLVALALVTEVLQGVVVGGRQGDPWDALADVLGVALVWVPSRLPGEPGD